MTITVENGNGLATANSYTSVAEADAYHLTFNPDSDWTTSDNSTKELALIRATRSIDVLYGMKFMSSVKSNTQNLLWPRYASYDQNGRLVESNDIPDNLKNAVSEVALLSIQGVNIMPTRSEKDNITDENITVGPIAISATYRNSGEQPKYENFSTVEQLLSPYLVYRKTITISR